jgi:hypothetical protein
MLFFLFCFFSPKVEKYNHPQFIHLSKLFSTVQDFIRRSQKEKEEGQLCFNCSPQHLFFCLSVKMIWFPFTREGRTADNQTDSCTS